MSTEDYSDQFLKEYLLGLLPEAETERLDELSVTEEEFAQRLVIAEHDLIDAYVNGELPEEELTEFRKQYSRSPQRIERVQFAQAFQSLNKTRDETGVMKTSNGEDRSSTVSFFNFGKWLNLKWGLVTSGLLLVLLASWFVVQQLRQRSPQMSAEAPGVTSDAERQARHEQEDHRQPEQPTPASGAIINQTQPQPSTTQPANQPRPRVVALVLKPQMRSVSQPVELPIPDDTTSVALTLQLEPSEINYFRTILMEGSSDRTIWRGGRVKRTIRNDTSVLSVQVPAALLKSQVYRIRVVGIDPNGTEETIGEYSFRVVK